MLRTGIDLVEIGRFEKSFSSEKFRQKVFGEHELADLKCKAPKPALRSAAAYFAAKEAFSKALSTGIRGFSWNEVEVVHDENGCPSLLLSGNAEKLAASFSEISLSLTHTDCYAAAVVVAVTL